MLFENEQEKDGKIQVPVVFTLNGRKIMIRDEEDSEVFMDSDKQLFPYIGMNEGCSVVAKVGILLELGSEGVGLKTVSERRA